MRAIDRAWRGAKSEWRMHAVSALSSSVAFLCLAFALLMVTNLTRLETRWQTAGQLSAYLEPSAHAAQVAEVVRALRNTRGVATARHLPAETARTEMLEASPTTLLEVLPSGAFPSSVEVELEPNISPDRARVIVQQLKALPDVESVETYGAWTARVSRFVRAANVVAVCLTLIVFLAVVTVVSSTTKLMLERRRDEVEVLRTVGATSEYVRRPFLLEGAIQGAFGALGALVLCGGVFGFLDSRFDAELTLLLGIEPTFLPFAVNVGLVGTGAVLGGLAAFLSLRKSFTV
jgi:cell division transport system permease protein